MSLSPPHQHHTIYFAIILMSWCCLTEAYAAQRHPPPGLPELASAASEQQNMWQLVTNLSNDFFNLYQVGDPVAADQLFTGNCDELTVPSATAAALKAEALAYTRDYGLSLNGVYSDSATSDGDEGSAYVELAWNLLDNGRRENLDRAKLLDQQAQLAQIQHQQQLFALSSRCVAERIGHTELGRYGALLRLHNQLLTPAEWLERRAYLNGISLLDELLDAQSQLAVTNIELRKLHNNPRLDTHLTSRETLPIMDIDIKKIIAAIRLDPRPDYERQLQRQSLTLTHETDREIKLRLYLRQQIPTDSQPADLVAGVRVSMPVGHKAGIAMPQRFTEINQKIEQQQWQRVARTLTAYDEFSEQLTRVTRQHYRLLRAAERLRQVIVARNLQADETDLATAATRLHSTLLAAENLITAKRTLYMRLNRVIRESQLVLAHQYLTPLEVPNLDYRARLGQRLLYIWSKNFNQKTNVTLIDLIRAKGMKQVVVSAGKQTNPVKLRRFIAIAENNQIQVELTLGDNRWIFPEQHEAAVSRSLNAANLSERLHLDVEPQALPDYKKNRVLYEQHYLQLVRRISGKLTGQRLTVAVPLHWRSQTYAELAPLVDELYVMAYEQKSSTQVVRRLQPLLAAVPVTKLRLLASAADFPSEWEMEQRFIAVAAQTGISRFGVHALNGMLQMAAGSK
ncbi:MAG: hypothetical protein KUG54_01455 [Gammaproteobacteria bacterium]|nr:hypothetical protein [Gammaproteobacteria bacterium]